MSSSWQEEDKLGEEVSHWQLSAQPVGDAIIMLPAHWPERDMWSTATGDQDVNHGGFRGCLGTGSWPPRTQPAEDDGVLPHPHGKEVWWLLVLLTRESGSTTDSSVENSLTCS